MGVVSFVNNVSEGNVGAAVVDAIGVVVDSIATVLPIIPGGVGATIKAVRAGDKGLDTLKNANKAVPDSTVVCRGGACKADSFTNGTGVKTDPVTGELSGVSTGIGDNIKDASANIPHDKVGVTTAGKIRAAGGKVVNDKGNHANVSGITAEKAAEIFKEIVKNPNK